MRNKHKGLMLALFLAAVLLVFPGTAFGDAGGFSGGSSYGGGGSSSGGSSGGGSWGSSSGYSHSYSSGSSNEYSGDSTFEDFLNLVVIGAFWVLFVTRRRRGQSSDNGQPAGATPTPQSRLKPIETLAEIDPSFDQDAFCQWLEQIYVHMQEAWTAGDFTPMRVYFSNTLYAQFDRQLAALRLNHHTNHVDDIVVQNVVLRGWYEAGGEQCLVVNVRARIVDYTVDDDSGAVVAGDTHTRKLMTYEYTFARTTGAQSATADGTHTIACPNCGGAVDINQSAKCTHCGAILNARDYNWTIVEIKGLSQQNLR